TFIIIRTYKLRIKNYELRIKNFYHIDLYRTETRNDLLGLGIDEIIKDRNNTVAVEWAEKMGDMLPDKRIELYFKYIDENKREIKIKYI
nr:tRNA (adenosine(37)-N6)-threonylcarbamoyltransferase complex ATPase subunit type 1 TsaE [Candidatus Levybacteria bacterium]